MKTFGIISSIIMWGVAVWAALQPDKQLVHLLFIYGALVVLSIHIIEVSFFFWHPKMKQHLSATNILMTLLVGAFHFMPLYKGTADNQMP
jgi:uncharacterized protein YhhL (DUF1145 family)